MTKRVKIRLIAGLAAGVLNLALILFAFDTSTLEKWLAFPVGALTVFVLNWGLEWAFDRTHRAPKARSIPDGREEVS